MQVKSLRHFTFILKEIFIYSKDVFKKTAKSEYFIVNLNIKELPTYKNLN